MSARGSRPLFDAPIHRIRLFAGPAPGKRSRIARHRPDCCPSGNAALFAVRSMPDGNRPALPRAAWAAKGQQTQSHSGRIPALHSVLRSRSDSVPSPRPMDVWLGSLRSRVLDSAANRGREILRLRCACQAVCSTDGFAALFAPCGSLSANPLTMLTPPFLRL